MSSKEIAQIAKLITDDPDILFEGWTLDGWVDDDKKGEWSGFERPEDEADPNDEQKRSILQNALIRQAQLFGSQQTGGPEMSHEQSASWDQINGRDRRMLADEGQNDSQLLMKLAKKYADVDGKEWEILDQDEQSEYHNEVLSYFSEELGSEELG